MNRNKKKIFVVEFVLLIVFILLIVGVLEYLYKDKITRVDYLYSCVNDGNDNIELAIIGNSHAGAMGCTPFSQTNNIGNYSIGGQDLFHASLVVDEVLTKKKKMKYLVLFVDYDLMGYSLVTTNQRYIDREYFKYADTMQDMSLANLIMARLNFFRNNRDLSKLRNTSIEKSVNTEKLNYIPIVNSQDNNSLCKMRAKEMTSVKFNKDLLQENEKLLTRTIAKVIGNNVRMIVVVPPKRECFYQYANEYNTKISKKSLYKVVNSYSGMIDFIDLYEDVSFLDDDFADPDHANSKGVDKIVLKLDSYVK